MDEAEPVALGGAHRRAGEEAGRGVAHELERDAGGGEVVEPDEVAVDAVSVATRVGDVLRMAAQLPGDDDAEDANGVGDVSESALDADEAGGVGDDAGGGLQLDLSGQVDEARGVDVEDGFHADFDDVPPGVEEEFGETPPFSGGPLAVFPARGAVEDDVIVRERRRGGFGVEIEPGCFVGHCESRGFGELAQEARKRAHLSWFRGAWGVEIEFPREGAGREFGLAFPVLVGVGDRDDLVDERREPEEFGILGPGVPAEPAVGVAFVQKPVSRFHRDDIAEPSELADGQKRRVCRDGFRMLHSCSPGGGVNNRFRPDTATPS